MHADTYTVTFISITLCVQVFIFKHNLTYESYIVKNKNDAQKINVPSYIIFLNVCMYVCM